MPAHSPAIRRERNRVGVSIGKWSDQTGPSSPLGYAEKTHVGRVVQSAADKIRPAAARKGIELSADCDEAVQAKLDPVRLEQVVLNLLANAVKFTPAGGRVSVLSRRSGEDAIVEVTDTGLGIAVEHRERIFEEFSQLDSGLARSHDGTGLGLTLTRRLVQHMGGEIEVESEVGRGSLFRVRLPRRGGRPVLRVHSVGAAS